MAAQIGSLYVSLTMNSAPFVTGMGQARVATQRAAAGINRDMGLSQRTVNSFTSSAGNRNFRPYAIIAAGRAYETAADRSNLLRGSLLALTSVAGGFAAALGTNLLSRYADAAVNLNNQLKTVSNSSSNLLAINESLEDVAKRSRSSLQATITLYARTARAAETFGVSQQKVLRVTETIQKAFSIGGASSAEAQGAAVQLSQGIASDRFSGEEYRSVSENAPVLLRGMAESLGVTIGRLREMAHAGELTATTVIAAILKASSRIDKEFAETTISIERAITQVDNKLLEYVGTVDKAYGITSLLSGGILAFGDNLDKIIPTLTTAAALVGAVFFAKNKGALGAAGGAILGGGIGSLIGGTQGGIIGSLLGGAAGFASSKKDEQGMGVLQRIKSDAAAAKQKVLDLAATEKVLRAELIQTGLAANKARRDAAGNLIELAPGSARSKLAREDLQIQALDQKKLNLIDEQRDSYVRLAQVHAQISPKAAKLADTQAKAEIALAESLKRQLSVQQQIKAVGADARAMSAIEGTAQGADPKADVKARIALQKELAGVEASVAKQRASILERNVRISGLATEADRKSAAERIAITKQIYAQTDDLNRNDEARLAQVRTLAQARADAERAGAEIARTNVAQTAAAYRGVGAALETAQRQMQVARRAASPLGQSFNFVGRQASSLIGLFGGPWGVALTGAALIFAKFAADAQERAQKIANAKSIIDEVLENTGTGPKGQAAGSIIANELSAIEDQMNLVEAGAGEALLKLKALFGLHTATENPLEATATQITKILNLPIQSKLDELEALTVRFATGSIGVVEFRESLARLVEETNNARFTDIAGQVTSLANVMAGAGPAVDALKNKIVDLQLVANDPINVVIRTSFDAIDEQPINAPLSNALPNFVKGQAYTKDLDAEIKTLRLTGDARKRAQYTQEQLTKAETAGLTVTDAIRGRIAAYVDEKIALENRDAAVKTSAKEDPYEKAVASIKEKTAAQVLENNVIGQSVYVIEKAKAIQELENAAKEAKLALSPSIIANIEKEADAYARAIEKGQEMSEVYDTLKDAFVGFGQDLRTGFTSKFLESQSGHDDARIGYISDLLAKATKNGTDATIAQRKAIIELADAMADAEFGANMFERAWTSAWGAAADAAVNALDKLASKALDKGLNAVFDILFNAVLGGVTGSIGAGAAIPAGGFIPGITGPLLLASGGRVAGPGTGTSDSIFARLSNGEFVMNADATRRHYPMLKAMNDNRLPGYAYGGLVGEPSRSSAALSSAQSSGGMSVGGTVNHYAIDARGAQRGVGPEIAAAIENFEKNRLPVAIDQHATKRHRRG